MNKPLPPVQFKLADIKSQAEIFYSFLSKHSDRFRFIFDKIYPELSSIFDINLSRDKNIELLEVFVTGKMTEHKEKISSALDTLTKRWSLLSEDFLTTLSEHFETEWPENKHITGYISVLPVFPRYLDDYSFYVGFSNIDASIETTAHEILHFLWFKKWKEVFPDTKRNEYETPHLVWRLSEIMDPIILQCHPKIKALINPRNWGYNSFKDIRIGSISMTDHFKDLYTRLVKTNIGFDEILANLYDEAQKYEEEISKF